MGLGSQKFNKANMMKVILALALMLASAQATVTTKCLVPASSPAHTAAGAGAALAATVGTLCTNQTDLCWSKTRTGVGSNVGVTYLGGCVTAASCTAANKTAATTTLNTTGTNAITYSAYCCSSSSTNGCSPASALTGMLAIVVAILAAIMA